MILQQFCSISDIFIRYVTLQFPSCFLLEAFKGILSSGSLKIKGLSSYHSRHLKKAGERIVTWNDKFITVSIGLSGQGLRETKKCFHVVFDKKHIKVESENVKNTVD